MASSLRHVTIGFQGGQTLPLRVSEAQLEGLYKALGEGGWHELDSEDGSVRVHLGQVVFIRTDNQDQRVGFGA